MIVNDEIVIGGIAGRFPESANMDEFWSNLCNGVDMVTDIQDRWDVNSFPIPRRMGQLKCLNKLDANFMGIHGKQADKMDPRMRVFLELTHEAIIDAGINPVTIRGSRTGVYLGSSGEEALDGLKKDEDNLSGYCATGAVLAMMSNRISFTYDLKGPSMAIDTACSSSLLALNEAVKSIRTGSCDSAIVAGIHFCLDPKTTLFFTSLGITSQEGKCRSFDAAAEGYVRSEAAVVIYICKSRVARRSYVTIVHGKTNSDGYKTQGITFPSGIVQEQLLREVYAEAGVNPKDVDYVEAHGTGTKAGDPEEVNAIARVFCEGRDLDKPLLIGSVKSNMGHAEPASGLCQIAKVILSHQHGMIPGNLNYSNPNPEMPALLDGRIKVIDKNTEFNGSLVGVNSFGFGGANVHILLKLSPRVDQVSWNPEIPVIVPFSGRTVEVESSVQKLMETKNHHLFALLQEISQTNIPGHNFRSYGIEYENEIRIKCDEMKTEEKRPIWFMFSGMGVQYVGMVRDMMSIRVFCESLKKSIETVKIYDFDLEKVLYTEDELIFDDVLNSMVAITSVQVALIDLLSAVGIIPDGIIGHSLGEVASAYGDGCLTAGQTVLVSLARARAFNKAKFPGAMASLGLTWEEAERRCPENVYPACHNAIDNVTVSGPEDLVTKFVKELQDEGMFARIVRSSGFAFHSRYMNPSDPFMREYLSDILPGRTARTSRWISTSVPEDKKNTDLGKYCSVDYFVNNALATVRFYEKLQHIPQNAVVVEIAPRNYMKSILKRCVPNTISYIGLMNHNVSDNVLYFLESLGQLYLEGCIPTFDVLYDAVQFPAPASTPMISPAICWNHSDNWFVSPFQNTSSKSGGATIQISLNEDTDSFYSGHVIDGRTIFPATGYMLLVWTTFAKQKGKQFEQQPIVFDQLRFERNTMLTTEGSIEFLVNIFPENGDFEVYENDSAVFRGRIRELNKIDEVFPDMEGPANLKDETSLNTEDLYKELKLRGYDYSGVFRGIHKVGTSGKWAEIKWLDNWVGFLDTLLQISIIQHSQRGLYLPIRLQKAIIDPKKFFDFKLNNDHVPVRLLKHVKTIKAPGIELRDLKVSIAPRRPVSSNTTLSLQRFVPYKKDLEGLSPQHCLESFLEIVLDNKPGRNFVFAEVQDNSNHVVLRDFIPLFPTKFDNSKLFLITDDKSSKYETSVTVISMKEKAVVKDVNLLVVSGGSLDLVNELVAENGFLILRNGSKDSHLPEYQLVSQKLGTNLELYRRAKETSTINKSFVRVTNENFEWVEKAKHFVMNNSSKVFLYSEGVKTFGLLGFLQCLLREGYDNIRCYITDDDNYKIDFENPCQDLEHQISLDLVYNVHKNESWGCYCNLSVLPEELGKPRALAESFVNALHPGDLSTVQWIESPLVIEENKVNICKVHYSSLNFRDVMLATGKLSRDALPGDLAFQECVLGIEFSGELNGKFVCGMQAAKCLATSVQIDDSGFLLDVPDKWSLAEAATVPVAYGTAYYALLVRGRMRKGETVLIHAGSGGVGQAAIAIALSRNCKVITTVSTAEKRQFLKERFSELDDSCFTDSRNALVFESHVMEITNGRGVDIVLNSLAQDKLEASVRCLAKYGRFLEIGKFDLFNNTALGMEIFLRSVDFQGILLDDVTQNASEEKDIILDLIRAGIGAGVVKPLPYAMFSNNQLEEAFRFMATGKHMGKVVVSVRDDLHPDVVSLPRTYFHVQKSYVLVGGLGGMGLEIANWMVSRGARNLVFVSRSGVTSGYQAYRVKVWRDQGVKVVVDNSDVSTPAGAQCAIKVAAGLGQLGGIFNLALVLKDAMFPNQTAEHFEIVGKAKILATKELDKASRNLPKLDYFVCFSSIASSRGNAGQTSYGFANSFMERLCEERCNLGLPGLAIQWGAIGDVGVLHTLMGGKDVAVAGVAPQKLASCLEMFDLFLIQPHPVMSSFVLVTRAISEEGLGGTLSDLVAHVLGIKDLGKVKKGETLIELGMDSLMATEIKILLEKNVGISLPSTKVGQLTFSKLTEIESNQMNLAETDLALEFKQLALLPLPLEPIVKMASKRTNQTTLFMVHPLDGNMFLLERLIKEVDVIVYGLQCSKETPLDSIEALAGFYIEQIKSIQDKGPYQIGGYSYGAAVAFEMTIQLEGQGEIVENLLLLDGCHIWSKLLTQMLSERVENDDETWLLYFIFLNTPFNFSKVEAEISALSNSEERLNKAAEMLHEIYPKYSLDELRDLATTYSKRLNAGYSYEPAAKVKSRTSLIRAGATGFDKKLGNDYQLNQVCETPVNVLVVAGNHHCFHESPVKLRIPEMVNDIFVG